MKLKLVAVGTRLDDWINAGFNEYARRLPREMALELIEVTASQRRGQNVAKLTEEEGTRLLAKVSPRDHVVALDVKGRQLSTEQLSQRLENWRMTGGDVVFLIGGADGLDDACLERADEKLSLSALTFPHGLVRVISPNSFTVPGPCCPDTPIIAPDMPQSLSINDPLHERQSFARRSALLFVVAFGLVAILVVRLIQLQVWEFEAYQTRSDENRIQVQPLAPPRGLIFDRNGELLADNTTIYSLALVRERIDDMDGLLARLNHLVGLTDEDLAGYEKRLKRPRRPFEPVALKVPLTEEEIARLAVDRHRLPGVEIVTELVRRYPAGSASLFAHAVGSVRRVTEEDLQRLDPVRYSATRYLGRRGVERFYENSLHGEVGYQRVEIDAHGRIRQVLEISPPVSGKDITLHLDHRLQIAASARSWRPTGFGGGA